MDLSSLSQHLASVDDRLIRDLLPADVITTLERPPPPGNDTVTFFHLNANLHGLPCHYMASCSHYQADPAENGLFLAIVPTCLMDSADFRRVLLDPFLARGRNVVHTAIDGYHPPSS